MVPKTARLLFKAVAVYSPAFADVYRYYLTFQGLIALTPPVQFFLVKIPFLIFFAEYKAILFTVKESASHPSSGNTSKC